jgi:hypothetical protein
MDFGLVLRHVGEGAIDGHVVTQRRIARQARHALGGDPGPLDGLDVLALLGTKGRAGLHGCREGIEALIHPVAQDGLESGHDVIGIEPLDVVDASLLQRAIEGSGVEVDRAVVIAGADDVVEVDPAVEEVPGNVAHAGAQEGVGRHLVRAPRPLGRPVNGDEIFVTRQLELAELEGAIAVSVAGVAGDDLGKSGRHG